MLVVHPTKWRKKLSVKSASHEKIKLSVYIIYHEVLACIFTMNPEFGRHSQSKKKYIYNEFQLYLHLNKKKDT